RRPAGLPRHAGEDLGTHSRAAAREENAGAGAGIEADSGIRRRVGQGLPQPGPVRRDALQEHGKASPMKRVAVLTSGGDAPGMNAAVRAVTRGGLARGWEMYAVRNGYQGLLDNAFEQMLARNVGGIIQSGGTVLGSARCPEFVEPAGRAQALSNLRKGAIDALVVIGGNGSKSGSASLARGGFPVVGVTLALDSDTC